jgi:hypothetical protein
MSKVICNAAYRCPIKDCCHKKPHEPMKSWCNDHWATCYPAGILCVCVPVVNGRYKVTKRIHCEYCNGHGFTNEEQWHEVAGPEPSGGARQP